MFEKIKSSVIALIPALLLMAAVILPSVPVQAGDERVNPQDIFKETLSEAEVIGGDDIPAVETAIGNIVFTALTYVGVITLVLIIYAGGLWVLARGNEQQIERAKKILIGSIIGLIIIFMAGAIANVVIRTIGGVTS